MVTHRTDTIVVSYVEDFACVNEMSSQDKIYLFIATYKDYFIFLTVHAFFHECLPQYELVAAQVSCQSIPSKSASKC